MIGIYALWWEEENKAYIGQSSNIEYRWKQHIRSMEVTKTSNYKILEMYIKYGLPIFNVLQVCKVQDLDLVEIEWIKEFDSINNGLNIAKGGKSAVGINNFASKYTKSKILKVFSLLYRTNLTHLEISKRLNVHIGTISSISNGTRHIWLYEEYPSKYTTMVTNRSNALLTNKYPPIKDSEGNIHYITNIVEFCNGYMENIEPAHISAVMRGKRKSHKGFTLVGEVITKEERPTLLSPDGDEYVDIQNITEFCNTHKLLMNIPQARKGISRILNKERESYLGFRLK